uniref:Uncharacterized protein n=1 Tax=Mus spicilegus TaxID=10103 RepID=A0A8C6N578_MUSSI
MLCKVIISSFNLQKLLENWAIYLLFFFTVFFCAYFALSCFLISGLCCSVSQICNVPFPSLLFQ